LLQPHGAGERLRRPFPAAARCLLDPRRQHLPAGRARRARRAARAPAPGRASGRLAGRRALPRRLERAIPELPDVTVYIEVLESKVLERRLERVRLLNPFILRTAVPPISSAEGKRVTEIRRIGKRIVFVLEGPLYLVLHLMIAGRLRWVQPGKKPPNTLALLDF